MSWQTVHTIVCDTDGWWDDSSQGSTKAAATASAKQAGWLVEGKRQLCPWCKRLAETPVEPEPAPEPPVVIEAPPEPEPPKILEEPQTVQIPAVGPRPTPPLSVHGSRRYSA